MGTRYAVWPICAALALACAAFGQEKTKLEYRIAPGAELLYKTSGKISGTSGSHGTMEATLSGSLRFFVADADASGAMLVGCQPDTKLVMKTTGPEAAGDSTANNNDLSVCRMDRSGNPASSRPKDATLPPEKQQALFKLNHRELGPIALPAGEIAVGAMWNGETDAAILMGLPVEPIPAKITSMLAEIKIVDGRKCAVIESCFFPSDRKLTPDEPQFSVTGDVKTLFDIDGGFSRSVVAKLDFKVTLNAEDKPEEGTVSTEVTLTLDSMKALPESQAAALGQALKAVEETVSAIGAGDSAKTDAAMAGLKPEGLPEEWLAGFNSAAAGLKGLAAQAGAKP